MLGKGGLAGAGIAEQAEDLLPAILEPARNGLEGLVLLRGKLHGCDMAGFCRLPQPKRTKEDQNSDDNGSLARSIGRPCGVASAARCQLCCSAKIASASATPFATRSPQRASTQQSK